MRIQFIKGHIAIPVNKLKQFKTSNFYQEFLIDEDKKNDSETMDYSQVGTQLYIQFDDLQVQTPTEIDSNALVIEHELIQLCEQFTPGSNFNLNLLIWSGDGDFTSANYYTNDLRELQVNRLIEAPTRTLFTPKELVINS